MIGYNSYLQAFAALPRRSLSPSTSPFLTSHKYARFSYRRNMSSAPEPPFRSTISSGTQFEPEADRYHLYVSYGCPNSTRTILMRKLKNLEDRIGMSVISPRLDGGWAFANINPYPKADIDTLNNADYVKDLYTLAKPGFSGRVSVPLLWDKKLKTIVNNESSQIIRMLNSAFNNILPANKAALDFYPEDLRPQIDELNGLIQTHINDGVYRAGFATTQEAYDPAIKDLFGALDKIEKHLEGKDYLVGNRLTEADIRLFVTIVRFDPVYVSAFKCNLRTVRDGYPAINRWLRKLYWNNDVFKSSTDFDHIKNLYWTLPNINPTRIIPAGPVPHICPL